MDVTKVLEYVDELVFGQTGKHLDNLQAAILKGVFNGRKYTEIAKDYNCTTGHAKDEAYELWRILSEALGEDLSKSNVRAAIERLGLVNYQSPIIGNRVGSINLCSNTPQTDAASEIDDLELVGGESMKDGSLADLVKQSKLETIPRLIQLGLTAEQIAQAIGLPLSEVQRVMR